MNRADAISLLLLVVFAGGILSTAVARNRDGNSRSINMNNLKEIGLAFHNHNDLTNFFPYNGGANDEPSLKQVNYGWHHPNIRDSGTWVTQLLPFIELDPVFRNNAITATATDVIPDFFKDKENDKSWRVGIKLLLCAERQRTGFRTDTEKGSFPGPVTDFAINVFLNAPPSAYSEAGYAQGVVEPGKNGDWAAAQSRMAIQNIQDGTSNTLLVGQKALPPQPKVEVPKECETTAPVPAAAGGDGKGGDEGIFSPGNWKLEGKEKKLISTGTGRGHSVVKDPPKNAPKDCPADGGVPWIFKDSELKDKKDLPWHDSWGSPFEGGIVFAFADGSVRTLKYSLRGTVNFARLLYPSDGNIVDFDN